MVDTLKMLGMRSAEDGMPVGFVPLRTTLKRDKE